MVLEGRQHPGLSAFPAAGRVTPQPAPGAFAARLISGIGDAIGLPYVFGGRSVPPQAGYDCAGFVIEAYHRQGYNLTRREYAEYEQGRWYTNAQMLYDGNQLHTPIARVSDPQPGDLVFFERTYDTGGDQISHVALVVAPGRLLGAQDERAGYVDWGGVPYWTSRLVGYGRVQR